MAKGTNLFRVVLGLGGAAAAVILSRKESRDKLKDQYNQYKENPESYKANAKDLANQISSKANETIQDVKSNPKGYVERIKNDPKAFFEEEKTRFTNLDENKADDLEEGKFDDEGGATANNNLRVVSEEDLKSNKNALEDKK